MTAIVRSTAIENGGQFVEVFVNGHRKTVARLDTNAHVDRFVETLREQFDSIIPMSCWELTRDEKLRELAS